MEDERFQAEAADNEQPPMDNLSLNGQWQ